MWDDGLTNSVCVYVDTGALNIYKTQSTCHLCFSSPLPGLYLYCLGHSSSGTQVLYRSPDLSLLISFQKHFCVY